MAPHLATPFFHLDEKYTVIKDAQVTIFPHPPLAKNSKFCHFTQCLSRDMMAFGLRYFRKQFPISRVLYVLTKTLSQQKQRASLCVGRL